VYGVVLDGEIRQVNAKETKRLRAELRRANAAHTDQIEAGSPILTRSSSCLREV